MRHIRLFFWVIVSPPEGNKVMWSRSDFVQMIQTVQENGAVDLSSFELQVNVEDRHGGCRAERVGWLDVPRQPNLKGEWRVDSLGIFSEEAGTILPAPGA